MFSLGYCYDGSGTPGYRQMGVLDTMKEAKAVIQEKLAGQKIEWVDSNGKTRAVADGVATGYIFFKVTKETWIAIDKLALGTIGHKAVICKGELSKVKKRARGALEKMIAGTSGQRVNRVRFNRAGDNIEMEYTTNLVGDEVTSEIVLVRVG